MAQSTLPSLRDIARILFRQKFRAMFTFAAVVAMTVLAIIFLPRQYTSEAQMYIRLGREDMAIDPTAATGETMQIMAEREGEMKALVSILESRGVMEAVVAKLGAESILTQSMPSEERREIPGSYLMNSLSVVREWIGVLVDGQVPPEELAVRRLIRAVKVSAEKKSNMITVMCTLGSPRLAQAVMEEVVTEFQQRHIQAHQSTGSMEFFASQKERVRQELAAASQQLRDKKNATGVVSIEIQRDIVRSEIANLNDQVADASRSLAEARVKVAALRRQHPAAVEGLDKVGIAPEESFATGITASALDEMRQELYTLELQDRALAAKYFDEHPQRVAIRQQLQEGQNILAREELLYETSNIATFQSHLEALHEKISESQDKLQHVNRSEVDVKEAEEEVERIRQSFAEYEKSYEVSVINEALEKERMTNVRVVQPPTLELRAVSPKKFLLSVVGALGAIVCTFAVAIGSEYLDPTMKTTAEVEDELELPVLVSIPRMSRDQMRVR
ncbi:MAG: hypothetical protein KDB14_33350 [Planctomycetales bacterium]|nr:hypothetical protein [Planctomycetales bacterium]